MRIKYFIYSVIFAISLFTYPLLCQADNQKLQAPLFDNLGVFHHVISTKNVLAQKYFDQGFVLFYGFEWGESIRSFKEATRLDPSCGMCYWGLALALVNKINAPMTGHEYTDGKAAIQKALSLSMLETPEEQDYIKALSLRFQHAPILTKKTGAFSCHFATGTQDKSSPKELIAHANAMKKIVEKYPSDNDAKALYVYALFNEIEWKFWDANEKINPLTPLMIKTLESIIAKDKMNIGGNHYYIHVIEQSPKPENALASANRLTTLVPGSEHLVHMPTHIYFVTGRYHQATDSNLQAIAAFQQYNKICFAQGFEPEINYLYFHNYDFLRTTAIMEGRKQLALTAAQHIVDQPFPAWLAKDTMLQWFIPIPYYVEARFGMWKDILKEPMPKTTYQYALGMWHYARGMAFAHTGNIRAAEIESSTLHKIVVWSAIESRLGKSSHLLLNIADDVLMATIADQQGNERSTLSHLQAADKIQHDMGYHEPPDWYFPMKEILADAYLKWGYPKKAIDLFEQDLQQYPNNGWALYGLANALRKIGEDQKADQVEAEFKNAWHYADIPKPVLLF